mmetsp:Transcript_13053/g.25594  ORF Transcript_13053/g.25594 Transcript_13053/m.25594 type:complete len:219 (-) Transcript_13053:172-828(-)
MRGIVLGKKAVDPICFFDLEFVRSCLPSLHVFVEGRNEGGFESEHEQVDRESGGKSGRDGREEVCFYRSTRWLHALMIIDLFRPFFRSFSEKNLISNRLLLFPAHKLHSPPNPISELTGPTLHSVSIPSFCFLLFFFFPTVSGCTPRNLSSLIPRERETEIHLLGRHKRNWAKETRESSLMHHRSTIQWRFRDGGVAPSFRDLLSLVRPSIHCIFVSL